MTSSTFMSALVLLCLFASTTIHLNAQGCSDAGFCSVGSLGVHGSEMEMDSSMGRVTAKVTYGLGDQSINVVTPSIGYDCDFGAGFSASLLFTAQLVNGELGSSTGLGDFYVTGNYQVFDEMSVTLATKIPMADGNAFTNGKPLPMDYQSSLGTFDVIVGTSFSFSGLVCAVGLQMPLSQNANTFDPSLYHSQSVAQVYPSTYLYNRKPDVLVRVNYDFNLTGDVALTASLLPIYHIANDTRVDSAGMRVEIVGSKGLTFNAVGAIVFSLSSASSLGLTVGAPFVTRDIKPDGLTRSFVSALEFKLLL